MGAKRRRILIVGAGLGGLTLANLLRRQADRPEVLIYERDRSAAARPQGYSLSLKDPGGLTPLRRLGLYDEVRSYSAPVAALAFLASDGRRLMTLNEDPASPQATLRPPRAALRETLLRDVGAQVVFGETCVGYRPGGDRVTAMFAGGRTVEADLLVACDGVNSAVRGQLIGDRRRYLGVASIQGRAAGADDAFAPQDGFAIVMGGGSSLFVMGDGSGVGWSLATQAREGGFDQLDGEALKAHALAATTGWAEPFRRLVEAAPPETLSSLGGFYDRKPLPAHHASRVLLLGDAGHPMSPFRGEGANMAMLDALALSEALERCGDELPAAAAAYSTEIGPRCRKAVLLSRSTAREIHSRSWLDQQLLYAKLRLADRFVNKPR